MMSAIAPIWDGNETWLVVTGVVLWGAFPIVYATLLSAFYLPLLLMLAGLILRGVAFEFRHKTERMALALGCGFAGGSLVAAFMQGLTVGAWSRACRSPMANIPAAISAGSVPSPCSAASACASAMRCSAPLAGPQMRRRCPGPAYRLIPSLSLGAAHVPDRRVRLMHSSSIFES